MAEKDNDFNPYPLDSYDTPENVPLSWMEYVFLRTRLSFYIRNFYIYYKSGRSSRTGYFPGKEMARNSFENIQVVESCGGTVHLRGLNNLTKAGGPVVIVGNHMSLLETAVMHAFVRPRMDFCFVIKKQLFDVPFFGDICRYMQNIGVGRENPRDDFRAVLEEGKERLKNGKSVIIFPQSTRSAVFRKSHFNTIGTKLARAAGVPVVPLALRTDFLSTGKLIKDMGPVNRKAPVWFAFGEPIPVEGTGKEAQEKVVTFITSRLKEWGCRVEE